MANNERFSWRKQNETSPNFFIDHSTLSFLIRKASVELKITLRYKTASVEVAKCTIANRPLAESVARIQQQLLSTVLRNYAGENHYAYLLALYSHQGWSIKEVEEEVFAKKKNGAKPR